MGISIRYNIFELDTAPAVIAIIIIIIYVGTNIYVYALYTCGDNST